LLLVATFLLNAEVSSNTVKVGGLEVLAMFHVSSKVHGCIFLLDAKVLENAVNVCGLAVL